MINSALGIKFIENLTVSQPRVWAKAFDFMVVEPNLGLAFIYASYVKARHSNGAN